MKSFTLYPIGTVKAEGETAALQLDAAYIPGLDGLEEFSHLVVLWWFDRCDNPQDRAMVRQLPHTGPKKEWDLLHPLAAPPKPDCAVGGEGSLDRL